MPAPAREAASEEKSMHRQDHKGTLTQAGPPGWATKSRRGGTMLPRGLLGFSHGLRRGGVTGASRTARSVPYGVNLQPRDAHR